MSQPIAKRARLDAGTLAATPPRSGALSQRSALTPGGSGETLSQNLIDSWGECYRCGQMGHFARDCMIDSKVFKARYDSDCPICYGSLLGMDCCFDNGRAVHVRCALERKELRLDATRRRLNMPEDDVAAEPQQEQDDVARIMACVKESNCNIGVNARAGSGKTHVIALAVHEARARNERVLAITLNRDAAQELRERGVPEAYTYHSIGARAWYRAHKQMSVMPSPEEQEGAAEEAAGEADDKRADEAPVQDFYVPNKTKLLLQLLYPKPPDDPNRRTTLSLEVALFEQFVVGMVQLAKMEAVRVEGGRPDTEETWRELCHMHEMHVKIEVVLKKKLSAERKRDAERRWPTPMARLNQGLRMAWACFDASIKVAQQESWQPVPGGPVVRELGGKGTGSRARQMPVLDWDDLLFLVMLLKLQLDPGPLKKTPGGLRHLSGDLQWLFADEAQDNSRVRALMLQRLRDEAQCRFFCVGDDMQALYGWAYSMHNALPHLFETFLCEVFDLPICRRCPASHIELANRVMEEADESLAKMRPMNDAPSGTIIEDATFKTRGAELEQRSLVPATGVAAAAAAAAGAAPAAAADQRIEQKSERVILARRNAPLLALLYSLANRGVACRMLGKANLAKKIERLLKKLSYDRREPLSLDELESALGAEVRREQDTRDGDEAKGAEYALSDLAECVRFLIGMVREGSRVTWVTRDGVLVPPTDEDELDRLHELVAQKFGTERGDFVSPKEREQVIELSTVHKAKGLGWPIVYLLEPNELPMDFIIEKGGWQARQELNVQYVAYTRAERTLIFLKNVIPQGPKGEGFSLREAIKQLFEDDGGANAAAPPPPRTHPRNDPRWSGAAAFEGWRQYHQQQQETSDDEPDEATARATLNLPALPTPLTMKDVDVAYRKRALQVHPDRCHDADAKERMQEVQSAKDVLHKLITASHDP